MKRWEILYKTKDKNKNISEILLENRGIKTVKEKEEFFNPTLPENITLIELGIDAKEIQIAIKRIKKALDKKEDVLVYGDYDADGVSATAILWEALYNLGVKALPYIPERFTEGYGLNVDSIRALKEKNPNLSLIITVDHGIVANKKVDFAKELGVDIIITDHHQPSKTKPKSLSIIHTTKVGGAAVSWVLAREATLKLGTKTDFEKVMQSLELVAIGSIADQIPLLGPCRSFVKYGLQNLNKTKRLGLDALFEVSRLVKGSIGTYEVGFIISPRINAMGRLEHAMEALRLMCTRKVDKARELAVQLNKSNLERQKIVEQVVIHARKQLGKEVKSKMIILAHESYHEGVIGLAAGKLVEEFYRPVIMISIKENVAKASARSVGGFNIIENIRKASEFLIDAGGHPMAAGFSIESTKIAIFSKRMLEIATPLLTDEILTKSLKIDLEIELLSINDDLFEQIKKFEPTGLGNYTPVFVTNNVQVVDVRTIGQEGKHLKLKLEKNGAVFTALAFGMGELYEKLNDSEKIDVAYMVDENIWNNSRELQLKIRDIKFS